MKIETLINWFQMDLGSVMMSLGYKRCQSCLSQGNKSCKFKVIDLSVGKCFNSLVNFFFIAFLQ